MDSNFPRKPRECRLLYEIGTIIGKIKVKMQFLQRLICNSTIFGVKKEVFNVNRVFISTWAMILLIIVVICILFAYTDASTNKIDFGRNTEYHLKNSKFQLKPLTTKCLDYVSFSRLGVSMSWKKRKKENKIEFQFSNQGAV